MPMHVRARSVAGIIGIVADIIVNGDNITADTLRSGLFVEVVEVISCAFNCKLLLGDTTADGLVENDDTRDIKTNNKEMISLRIFMRAILL